MARKDNIFDSNAMAPVESNRFDLSHDRKLTFNMGELIPSIRPLEVIPGDSFNFKMTNFLRFLPLVAPVMHRVRVKTELFFCPNRIVYDGWEGFITGTDNPPVAPPTITFDDVVEVGSIADYLGIPPGDYSDNEITVSALPFAAYFKIYDEWYRDQNLISEKFVPLVPGDNSANYLAKVSEKPLHRCWEHDYFTSCLPFSQQGSTEVSLPLTFQDDIPVTLEPAAGTQIIKLAAAGHGNAGGFTLRSENATPSVLEGHDGTNLVLDPNGTLSVDIQSDAATINDLREAWSLQAFLERSIRGGLRYIEQIFSHFHVKSSDSRLQRPELIGRATQNMTIGEVLATAQSNNDGATAEIAVGSMAGHGISVGDGMMNYYSEEHGWILGFISVIPDTAYQNGIDRSLTRFDRLDYYWPSFANLGEQAVKRKELQSVLATGFDPEADFGFIPRYSEMRYLPSSVAGQFRDSLAYWTLGRIFDEPDNPPGLNEEFVTCNPRFDIFAVTDPNVHHVIAQIMMDIQAVRKLPRYAVPSTLR